MKTLVLVLILYFCVTQMFFAQEENGVVSLSIPVRNSLTFNRYAISPTFSFVREQNKYISMYNKREWVQFEDAPITYLASYTGRFAENIGAGFGMFLGQTGQNNCCKRHSKHTQREFQQAIRIIQPGNTATHKECRNNAVKK